MIHSSENKYLGKFLKTLVILNSNIHIPGFAENVSSGFHSFNKNHLLLDKLLESSLQNQIWLLHLEHKIKEQTINTHTYT